MIKIVKHGNKLTFEKEYIFYCCQCGCTYKTNILNKSAFLRGSFFKHCPECGLVNRDFKAVQNTDKIVFHNNGNEEIIEEGE